MQVIYAKIINTPFPSQYFEKNIRLNFKLVVYLQIKDEKEKRLIRTIFRLSQFFIFLM